MKLEAKARLTSSHNDVDLLLKLAKASDEEIDRADVEDAIRVGNRIYAYGKDSDTSDFIVFTFEIDTNGKSGSFGGAPESSHKTRAEAAAAMKRLAKS